jgi:uncharacterized membrane protein
MPNTLLASTRSATQRESRILFSILVLYLIGRIIEVLPFSTPSTRYVALEILCAFTFALIHGARHYGLRGILIFTSIALLIGNILENIGVATGFPYGHYVFLSLMGPKLLSVPILLGLAYIGMAYVSWTLSRLIVGATGARLAESQLFTVPLLASFIMTAWDLAQDPVWSTFLHAWRWFDGGIWFGVPLTNYAGWLLTVFLIYIAFAFYLRATAPAPATPSPHWRLAVLFYTLCALGNILQLLRPLPAALIADPTGTVWHAASILQASALVSIFIMGSFALAAWLRAPVSGVPTG